jgi:basic amino acid/polyamine antiporter, APA family
VSDQLARRLTTGDAVMVGLGAMLGAGVFAAFGPAAEVAGAGLLVGLALAAAVAFANATSSAQLAAIYPQAGGTYVYGRKRLGEPAGVLAGIAFVVGKTASCAAMALTFGAYVAPELARPLAIGAVVALTAVNLAGVHRTAAVTRTIVAMVLAVLATVAVATFGGGAADPANLSDLTGVGGWYGILQSAGLLFFAFAGYARIATLGEEVVEPERTIPRAIPIALGIALGVYALIGLGALLSAGPDALAGAAAPLATAVEAGRFAAVSPVVRAGAALASAGVLLSLLVGVSRTSFAMARDGHLPMALARISERTRVPHVAEVTIAAAVIVLLATPMDLRGAIGFSSFGVLLYYAIANASAVTLSPSERRWPRWIPVGGVIGCAVLMVTLPLVSILSGAAVLVAGSAAIAVHSRWRRSDGP